MRWVKRLGLGLLALIVLAIFGLYMWFWGKPVGITNYVNKATGRMVLDSPETLTYLGLIDNTILDRHSGKLGDYTQAAEDKMLKIMKEGREGLDKYGPDGLEGEDLLSYEIAKWLMDEGLAEEEFKYSGYPINQLSGPAVNLPQFLTDTHAIVSEKSVRRYLSRLSEFSRVMTETKANVEEYRDNGVVAPDFILEKTLVGLRAFIESPASENPLVATLGPRMDKVEGLSDSFKSDSLTKAEAIVASDIYPAYQALITVHEDMLKTANHDAGIWRIPRGDEIYKLALRSNTTTDMTADEIHNIGVAEVARIETEMAAILDGQGLTDGTITERIQALMKAPEHNFPNTDEGRAEMIAYLEELNEGVMAKAGDYFGTLPDQKLEILRVPEYSQDSAPGGYYSGPSLDGKRPGRFYINLKDTRDNPRWTLPTLLYHEAAPGHHFQISRSQKIKDVPMIRTMSPFTAYTEGWALYSERLAAEDMGMYDDDPLGDLGRLQAEMFRAVRLVVDTGMHHKRWSREQAIEYMSSKTGMSEAEVTREIERYVVWPGQATAYKTGQLAILRMRDKAEAELGADFDLKAFNETLLKSGAMPLGILERQVDSWIAEQKG